MAKEGFFDDLARGLADGTLTRGKALKLMGAAVVGGALGSLGIGEVSADPIGCKRNGKNCTRNGQCCSGNCSGGSCRAQTTTTTSTSTSTTSTSTTPMCLPNSDLRRPIPCTADGECCSGICTPTSTPYLSICFSCRTPGDSCRTDADCCTTCRADGTYAPF
jgi:hypothetical protein